MKIQMFDKVLLKSGNTAYIVEIFDGGQSFIADIDIDEDTITDYIKLDDIEEVIG